MIPSYFCVTQEQLEFSSYKFDHIFVCLSPQYIPPQYWHYFNMFIDAYKIITKNTTKNFLIIDKKYGVQNCYKQITKSLNI
jgi:hypothetical protein